MTRVPLSVLDLAPISAGSSTAQALRNSLDLARQAEEWATSATGLPSITSSLRPVLRLPYWWV